MLSLVYFFHLFLLYLITPGSAVRCCASNLTVNFSTIIVGRASCPSLYSI
jgi:hypothetical protein